MYVTRLCLEKIGKMDERYFLYYEDGDWSLRAKKSQFELGYASKSIVFHKGGTTIGSSTRRADKSELAVYLEARNKIEFIRSQFHSYLPVAILISLFAPIEYLVAGSPRNFRAAAHGVIAGLRGETGRPRRTFGEFRLEERPRALILSTTSWPPIGRTSLELVKTGFDVASLSPRKSLVRSVSEIFCHYKYRSWMPLRSITRAINTWQPDVVFCADDKALNHLCVLHARTSGRHNDDNQRLEKLIRVSLGDPNAIVTCSIKSELITEAQSLGLRCPRTLIAPDDRNLKSVPPELEYPFIVKDDRSWGGLGVRVAANYDQYRSAIRMLRKCYPPRHHGTGKLAGRYKLTLQEKIVGRPATCAAVCYEGEVLAAHSVEVLECMREFGPASLVRFIDHPEIKKATEVIVTHFHLSGFIGIDFIIDKENRAWLLEVNPRITPMCHLRANDKESLSSAIYTRLTGRRPLENPAPFEKGAIALFPQELIRRFENKHPSLSFHYHDVPWEEPLFVLACLNFYLKRSIFKRLRRKIRILRIVDWRRRMP